MTKFVIILVAVVIVAAIILTGVATYNATKDNPVKQAREEATAAVIYAQMTPSLAATPTPNGTPTPGMAQIALTVAAQEQAIQIQRAMTQDANQLAMEKIKQDAEVEKAKLQQQVELAKVAAQQTSESNAYTATADRQAIYDLQTAQAIQTHAPETAVARTETATAQYFGDQLTKTAVPVVQTVEWGNAIKVSNAAKGDSATIYTKAYVPPLVILFLVGAAIFGLVKFFEMRTVSRDEAQRNKTITIHHKNGTTVANQDRIPSGLFSVSKDGTVIIHQADRAEQAKTTERDQMVDGLQSLPPGREREAGRLMNNILGRSGAPERLTVHGDGSLRNKIIEADETLMEDE